MYKISNKVISFITNDIDNWKLELTAAVQTLAEVIIQRGFLPGGLVITTDIRYNHDATQLRS